MPPAQLTLTRTQQIGDKAQDLLKLKIQKMGDDESGSTTAESRSASAAGATATSTVMVTHGFHATT